MMLGRYQFVWWWPEWQGIGWQDWGSTFHCHSFSRSLYLGWLEVRVWR